jgi:hypothetical protein
MVRLADSSDARRGRWISRRRVRFQGRLGGVRVLNGAKLSACRQDPRPEFFTVGAKSDDLSPAPH